jgi:CRISPR-associated protein Csh1
VKKWLINCENINDIDAIDLNFIKTINHTLDKNSSEISLALSEKLRDLNLTKKDKKFVTIKLEDGKKFLGDYDFFRNAVDYFYNVKTKKSSASGRVCSVCAELKDNVSARTFVYQFDTDDKPGFISGFNKKIYWRNIPVCDDCRALLRHGRNFIDSKLKFKFYGLNYFLIPLLLTGNKEILEEIVSILSEPAKIVSLKDRIKKRITQDEDEILEYLASKEDVLTLNFLFLQKQQSAERILLLIEDVFPSRIRTIFEAKDYVDNVYKEDFNFGKIRGFFSKSDANKKNFDLDKYFLEITDAVFKGKKLDFAFLAKFFMQTVRKEFINHSYYLLRIKDAMMCISFFEKLGLITFEEASMQQSTFESIFIKYGKSLNTPQKRGIFLLGVLTQMLLNKQYSERNSKPPFMKKLKSLKMDERDIKALLPEVQNKLEEYESFDKGKRIIAQEASKYLLEAGDGWKISVDEINFYFACGMNLSEEIANVVYSKQEEKE